jgi:hypothetical protein
MKLLSWFLNPEVPETAAAIARSIVCRYPPSMDTAPVRRITPSRMEKILEDAYAKAIEFNSKNKMGWLSKARFGNAFRWELRDLGYTPEFVEMATEGLIVYLTKKSSQSGS